MSQFYLLLKVSFHNWASIDPFRGPAIPFNQFAYFMTECTATEPGQDAICERAFNEALLGRAATDGVTVRELVFSEFLEAAALVAITTFQGER
jgi:hypothetical protein